MATKKEKIRLSISLDRDLNNRIEVLANRMSMSKASLCNAILAQGIQGYEMAWEVMSSPQGMLEIAKMFKFKDEDVEKVSKEIELINNKEKNDNK